MVFRARSPSFRRRSFLPRGRQLDFRSPLGAWSDLKRAADILQSFAHILEPAAALVLGIGWQAASIILDLERETLWIQAETKPGGCGVSVFHDVVDAFFCGEKD